MSSIFSKVEAYDSDGRQSVDFRTPGFVRDESDFLDIDGMDDFLEDAVGDIGVSVEVYIFGTGESNDATDEEMRALTEDFIDQECDCIEVINFVIRKEDDYE